MGQKAYKDAQFLKRAGETALADAVELFSGFDQKDTFSDPAQAIVQSLVRFSMVTDMRGEYAVLRHALDPHSLDSFRKLEKFFDRTGLKEEDFSVSQDVTYAAYLLSAIADQTNALVTGERLDRYDALYRFAADIQFLFKMDVSLEAADKQLKQDIDAYFNGDATVHKKLGNKGVAGKICAVVFNEAATEAQSLNKAAAIVEKATRCPLNIGLDQTITRKMTQYAARAYQDSHAALQGLKDTFARSLHDKRPAPHQMAASSSESEWGQHGYQASDFDVPAHSGFGGPGASGPGG